MKGGQDQLVVVPPARGHHKRRQGPDGRTKEFEQVDVSPRLSAGTIDGDGSCQTFGHVDSDKTIERAVKKKTVKSSKGGLLGDEGK